MASTHTGSSRNESEQRMTGGSGDESEQRMTGSSRNESEMNLKRSYGGVMQSLLELDQEEELRAFGKRLSAEGFTAVRRFFEELREYLRVFMDEETATAVRAVAKARTALPDPGGISPSWQDMWKEFEGIVRYKTDVLERIPPAARDGEWQVLLDNPYSNQNIAVYPALTFQEAAYMYAYFRTGLERNEFIRLQKVDTVIMNTGADG